MKTLHKSAGISILLILTFMIIAICQFQPYEEMSVLPNQIEYFFNDGWLITSLDSTSISETDRRNPGQIQELIKNALNQADVTKTNLPYSGESGAGDIVVYKNTLPQDYAGLTMHFSSIGSSVRVFLDGTLIYEYGVQDTDTDARTDLSGSHENIADIPTVFEDGEFWIELSSPDPNAAAALDNVRIQTRDTVVVNYIGNSVTDIGCCVLIMIMSIIMFVLALIRHYTCQPARGELYLGLAGLAAGVYCFIGTDTLSIFYNIHSAYEMQEYLVLMIPIFLSLYFDKNLHQIYPRRFSALLLCMILNALAQMLLQILHIQTLANMALISGAAIGFLCAVTILSLLQFDFKDKHHQALLTILSLLVLLAGGIINMAMNAVSKYASNHSSGQYSMTIFSIMMAVIHILQLSREYRASAETYAHLLAEKVKTAEQQNVQLTLAKKDADAARHEALAANEAKGKFLAHMSHEIRTPINAVLGMDEMILRESKEPQIKEYAMDIYMAGQTLLSLINDILDFSKIDSGKMEIVPVEYDFSSLIHDLSNMTTQRAKDKNIHFAVEADHEIPCRLYGDDVRIRQILTNILTNAVKYTHEGNVWLRIKSRKTDDTAILTFEIEDTGIGIKEEDLPKLSAEFERIEEDRNRNIEGTGLGMSITIQLLSLLGSRLQVESIYGKGSRFYFELEQKIIDHTPIGDFETRVRQISENYNYSTKFCAPDANILVVDDNAVNRKVLRNLLKETQVRITDADNGLKCLELVQADHYDLIFLDHMMPEMDGIETLHRIKEFSDCPCQGTPIVVLTANAVAGAKEYYLSEGFDDFLSKPIVPEKLEQMIQKMLPDELLQEVPASETDPALPQHALSDEPGGFPENLPQVDGLDWQYAWLHLPDMELLEYTVKEFYAQIDSAAKRLEQAYEHIKAAKQYKQSQEPDTVPELTAPYRIQVHAMKSLAATVGILSLFGVAKILEFAARDGKTDILLSVTPSFLDEWLSYREKLQGVFGIGSELRKEVTDYSVMQALVEMVRISMQEMDIDQADQLVSQLQAYEYPQEMEPNIQKLAEAVTNLDPEEADRLAAVLIGQMGR